MAPTRSNGNGRPARGTRAATRAALDVMLTEAAVGPSVTRRFVQPTAAAKLAASLALHPDRVRRRLAALTGELAQTLAGGSTVQPARGDRRFGEPAWQHSWLFRRVMQSYLTVGVTVDALVADADLDWRAENQVRFMLGNILDALAPTNFPLTNPQVLKETIDQGGANLIKGGRRLARDVTKGQLPAMVDTTRFKVGENLALTEGSIIARDDVYELIQYRPQSDTVYQRPLLIVPPTINKYYVLDLAPGRSIVEYLLREGHQVFVMSWRNPDAEQAHFDLDTYAQAVIDARTIVAEVTHTGSANLIAACSGGIITAATLGHLAAKGRLGEVTSLTLLVCALDNQQAGTTGALATKEIAAAAVAESARRGYLDGEALANVFAWLRPNDLIWNYLINNYLLGKNPPAYDVLYWNQDTVRLAAGLHRDFVTIALENALTHPDGVRVLGSDVDLEDVSIDNYIVAGSTDHIVPWENAYRSTGLLGGDSRFILSSSGHIQSLINPPSPDSRASFRVAGEHPVDIAEWEARAVTKQGSWWPDYVDWLAARAGPRAPAPKKLGSRKRRATAKAPGTYVMAS